MVKFFLLKLMLLLIIQALVEQDLFLLRVDTGITIASSALLARKSISLSLYLYTYLFIYLCLKIDQLGFRRDNLSSSMVYFPTVHNIPIILYVVHTEKIKRKKDFFGKQRKPFYNGENNAIKKNLILKSFTGNNDKVESY